MCFLLRQYPERDRDIGSVGSCTTHEKKLGSIETFLNSRIMYTCVYILLLAYYSCKSRLFREVELLLPVL